MKRAVFIERDAILNEVRTGPKQQITPIGLEEFKVISAAAEPLKKLKAVGFVLVATTNQPGLSRGYQSRRELAQWSERELHDIGISWSDVAYEAEKPFWRA